MLSREWEDTIAFALRFVAFHGHSAPGLSGRARGKPPSEGGKTFPSGSATISKSFKA